MTNRLTRTSKQRALLGAVALLFLFPFSGLGQVITTYAGGNVVVDGAQALTQIFGNVASGVIHAPKVSTEGDLATSNNTASDTTFIAVPVVNASFTPPVLAAGDQGTVDLTIPFTFPHDISGTLTLGFVPDAIRPAEDPAVQFSTGGRTVAFTIPANTVQARLGGNSQPGPMGFQAGTISGNLLFNGILQTGTVETAFSIQATIPKQAPRIHSVQRETSSGGNFSLGLLLTSSPREVTQLVLRFVGLKARLSCGALSGCSVDGNQLSLDVRSTFDNWFVADTVNGSASTLHIPFHIDSDIKGTIVIRLVNRFGTSNSVNYALP